MKWTRKWKPQSVLPPSCTTIDSPEKKPSHETFLGDGNTSDYVYARLAALAKGQKPTLMRF